MVEYTRGRHRHFPKNCFRARRKADGWFRQLERLVRRLRVELTLFAQISEAPFQNF
jgi:hypothetical protein